MVLIHSVTSDDFFSEERQVPFLCTVNLTYYTSFFAKANAKTQPKTLRVVDQLSLSVLV